MRIAIIDADLICRTNHRFPNLVCLKLSGYYKEQGHDVQLVTSYDNLADYDKVFISKVFTDTEVPDDVLTLDNVEYGGTGFFYDKAPPLPYEIEHHMPDYHLYDDFVNEQIASGKKRREFSSYLDYSIGFTTRGCFRKCSFCVNKNYDRVFIHSPLKEFYDPSRPKICLLDDNFFGCPQWLSIIKELQATGKPFTFKQGLDERLLTDEKCEQLCASKYDGQITFAFDNIADYRIIEKKLQMIRRHTSKIFTFYVLVGYDRSGKWDKDFWDKDIEDAFKRIELLQKYHCTPYIMRYERYKDSPFRGMYINLARWCNQPAIFKKMSLREVAAKDLEYNVKTTRRYMDEYEAENPEIAARYYDMKWELM